MTRIAVSTWKIVIGEETQAFTRYTMIRHGTGIAESDKERIRSIWGTFTPTFVGTENGFIQGPVEMSTATVYTLSCSLDGVNRLWWCNKSEKRGVCQSLNTSHTHTLV